MSANLRDWYLDALGVVQYRSREEGVVDIPFHVELQPQPEPSQQSEEVSIAAIPTMLESAPQASTTESTSKQSMQKVPGQPVEPDVIQPLDPFRVACWQSGDDLLVIHAYPPGNVPLPEERDLLHNLLRAIGRLGADIPAADYIDWPLTQGEPADLQGAKSMLSVFLDTRIRKCGVLWVLLMGELPARLLMPSQTAGEQVAYEEVLGETEDLPGGARAVVIPSLQDMLTTVSSKQIAWRALQNLLVSRE